MRKIIGIGFVLAAAVAVWYLLRLRNAPPEVAFESPRREKLITSVSTNGRVEPIEWTVVRAEREGSLVRLAMEKGQSVAAGAIVAELDSTAARTNLAAAEAKIAQARAELAVVDGGGRVRDQTEIDGLIGRLRVDLAAAERQRESLQRLVQKKAATPHELEQASDRVNLLKQEIGALANRRASLISQPDRASAQARLQEAETVATSARRDIELSLIRAPIGGTVYQLDVRKGAFLKAGDPIGNIGALDRVRVVVYIDEPELGGVSAGQPVEITWEALPGITWAGVVEKLPAQIVALNSRQVGEVLCVIDNRDRRLLPQTNVKAEIRTSVIENALTIPKEVLRRDKGESGVFVPGVDSKLMWRALKTGASNVTRIQVLEGLNENERAALPSELVLRDGMTVTSAPTPRPAK
ncbi:MAG: efflux RND transporter periplasmic adaptor subunit [Candidatus Solibacter usitatus]|nr:efflux RND transporter periplasmic adaptor subunit [Candidatus Solibacter usitatus]